jgi:hypothetical protein
MITIESTTSQRLQVIVTTTNDPTGGVIDYALILTGEPTTWVAGSWVGAWDSTTGKAPAVTPTVGVGAALPVTGGQDYRLYTRWRLTGETPVATPTIIRVV